TWPVPIRRPSDPALVPLTEGRVYRRCHSTHYVQLALVQPEALASWATIDDQVGRVLGRQSGQNSFTLRTSIIFGIWLGSLKNHLLNPCQVKFSLVEPCALATRTLTNIDEDAPVFHEFT